MVQVGLDLHENCETLCLGTQITGCGFVHVRLGRPFTKLRQKRGISVGARHNLIKTWF